MRVAWAVTNNADVEENVRTTSMMVRKSRVEIEIYGGGDAEVFGPATSRGAVLGEEALKRQRAADLTVRESW